MSHKLEGLTLRDTSTEYPGHWVTCRAGDPAPLGALRAPDKFGSAICMWPGKYNTLGRGSENLHMKGMDAWFPYDRK